MEYVGNQFFGVPNMEKSIRRERAGMEADSGRALGRGSISLL